MSEILIDDPNCEVPTQLALPKFENFRIENIEKAFIEENSLQLQSLVKAIKKAFQKYRNQVEETKLKVTSLKEQNSMQQRTIEFLEDERQKMQQLNSQLSSQFETLNLKIQNFLKDDYKNRDVSEDKTTSCLETVIKSLNDQIESLRADRDHLLEVQEEMKSKIQECSAEKISLKLSEQNLSLELNRSSNKIEMLEKSLDTVRKDYQNAQETLHQTALDKELLEQEKHNFATVLSNLEKQCSDLKNCLEKLQDEENVVRESLMSVQNLNESLSMEKHDLSQLLADVRD
ncbi:uncharacterized protein LOC129230338 [Uloborus diversus]|uniref:uncharacterized protein LOC129230338 n=1 Tax=Uloborus diversus TaxID=327109 RepID=UPI0024093C05|nr:uncharacterized protein LOC129230338 [Uloborus diversus]